MRLTIALFLLGVSAIYHEAQAQTTVKGVVLNKQGEFLEGISVRGQGKATRTNEQGYFELYIAKPGEFNLDFSGVGFHKHHLTVQPNGLETSIQNQILQESKHQIEQIDVKGYNSVNHRSLEVSKSGVRDLDLPQAVQVINSQVISDQQVNVLSDALKNANGVALGANRGGVNENFYARGYSLGTNNIFKNGARTNNGGSIEASTLESVQILKGSAALLYGGVSGGAVLNLVTKKPKFENGGEVSMRFGSYNQYKPIVDVYGPISQKLAFRIIGTGSYAESFRDEVESKRIYVNPSLLYQMNDKSSLNVMFDYLKSDFTPDFGIGSVEGKIQKEVGRNAFINVPWAFNKTNSSNAQADFGHQFNDDWKLQVLASYQQYNRDYYGAERIQANAQGIAPRALNRTKQDELTYNQQINLTGKLTTGFLKHQILVGGDADESNVKNYAFNIYAKGGSQPSTSYDNIDLFNPYAEGMRTDKPLDSLKTRTSTDIFRVGAFVQDLVSVTDQFKVLLGVRYTYQNTGRGLVYDYKTNTETTTPNVGKDKEDMGNKIDKAWSPKFALIYQPLVSTSIYVSYSNNFVSNAGYDVNYLPMTPSSIDQYEAGIKNDFLQGRLSTNLTWYRIQNNNFAQTIIGADGKVADANMKEFTGVSASDGIELDVAGELGKGFNVLAGYSYNFMRYLETNENGVVEGIRLVGTTAHTGNATLFYSLPDHIAKGLKLGVSAFYTGKRNAGWNTTKVNQKEGVDRIIPIDPFTTFDFTAGYTYKNWNIMAKVNNIGNAFNYYVHENYSVNPIPPRGFTTTLSYKF
ncbi:TonB-dependent siderophore receptor [Sphingobacterium kyonggiense]|uniref:TonB-dependent siderophore receptor n=1 Tax=Sphingobacterium kyonggiense TaxID=714075 RepID=A0ABP7Z3T3_9SPHI